jgi:hypothetical protein
MCSDLSAVKLSRAAAASSAVPLVLSPMTFNNYGGTCNYQPPPAWNRFANIDNAPRTVARAKKEIEERLSFADSNKRPYLHLFDGGISDNVGMRSVLTLIELMRTFHTQRATFAFVVNEFGQTEGIVTLNDLLQTVVGEMMPFADDPDEALAVRRADGSWLLDGLLAVDEMKEKLGLNDVPGETFGNFHTVGGFVLNSLGRIPKKGESFDYADWRFEVVDVERNRVDEVLASPLPERPAK